MWFNIIIWLIMISVFVGISAFCYPEWYIAQVKKLFKKGGKSKATPK